MPISAFDRRPRSSPRSPSPISTRSSVRFFGSIVVSLSWAAIISPRPLKRLISSFLRLELASSAARPCARRRARRATLRAVAEPVERRHARGRGGRRSISCRHLRIEEGDQQRGDVGAVDVGVGHDDDALVAQVLFADIRRRCRSPAPASGRRAAGWRRACRGAALATLRILPRSGRIAWVSRSRACLAEPPAESPSTMKISVPAAALLRAVGELARQAQLARRRSGGRPPCPAALQPLLGALDRPSRAASSACVGTVGEPVVERVAHACLDHALRLAA